MSEPYTKSLIALAEQIAIEEKIRVQRGVYVAVAGPNLETRAEYRFLRSIGADVVGMSTVPEVIVAVHSSMKVLGISVVTDACLPDALEPVNIARILKTAAEAEPKLTLLMKRVVERI
jgi:purine-nucleoside phosphorylase